MLRDSPFESEQPELEPSEIAVCEARLYAVGTHGYFSKALSCSDSSRACSGLGRSLGPRETSTSLEKTMPLFESETNTHDMCLVFFGSERNMLFCVLVLPEVPGVGVCKIKGFPLNQVEFASFSS